MELINRLENVIKKDKQINPQYMKEVIKSDIFYLLNNYFEVEYKDINIAINLNENNTYKLDITAIGDRIKMINVLPR
ncbi:MAG: hypothetical protein J6Q15_00470 [Clostridia bacterium]|nr:hypothetical protein [Clostridia bacterium]